MKPLTPKEHAIRQLCIVGGAYSATIGALDFAREEAEDLRTRLADLDDDERDKAKELIASIEATCNAIEASLPEEEGEAPQ